MNKLDFFTACFTGFRSMFVQFVVCFIVGVLVFMLGYRLDINFLQRKHKGLREEIVVVKKQIQDKKRVLERDEGQQKSSVKLLQNVSDLECMSILSFLEKSIFKAGATLYLLEPKIIKKNFWADIYPIKLELNGEYKSLVMFINSVLVSSYLVVIDDLILKKESTNVKERLNMVVFLSFYQSRYELARSKARASLLSADILDRDVFKKGNKKAGLYLWSSSELSFLGLITEGQENFGVVGDSLGNTYQVKVGDRVGSNQSKITAIDERGIRAANPEDNIGRGG